MIPCCVADASSKLADGMKSLLIRDVAVSMCCPAFRTSAREKNRSDVFQWRLIIKESAAGVKKPPPAAQQNARRRRRRSDL
jgi:hypothetical protein